MKEFYRYRTYYTSVHDIEVFWAFAVISVVGLFNLVLETPTIAATYWVLLGFVARAIHDRKVRKIIVV